MTDPKSTEKMITSSVGTPEIKSAIFGWSLVFALPFAGFVSANFGFFISFWPNPHMRWIAFTIIVSGSFGLTLIAVLWFYNMLRSWWAAVMLLGVTIAVHLVEEFAEQHWPISLRNDVDVPLLGSIQPSVALTSFGVFLILCIACLLLTAPRGKLRWTSLIALVCALLTAGTISAIDATQRDAWVSFLKGSPLQPLWQSGFCFFFAIALNIKASNVRFYAPPEVVKSGRSIWIRLMPIPLLLLFWWGMTAWRNADYRRNAKEVAETAAKRDAEIARVVSEHPSLEDLPTPAVKRPGELLLLQEIDGWKPYYSGSQEWPAQKGSEKVRPIPANRTYYAGYSMQGAEYAVRVNVTEYPNAEWAKYEARITSMTPNPEFVKKVSRYGNALFQDSPYFYWPSGDRVIRIDCSGVVPAEIDKFLKVYLEKYPSSI